MPQNSGKATAAFDAVTQATGEQLSELVQGLYLLGDTLQRDMTDWAFRLLTPEVFNPWSDGKLGALQQSAEVLRNLDPVQGGWLTLRELQNKVQVFNLVRNIPTTLQLASDATIPVHCLKLSRGPMPWTNTLLCGPWKV